MNSDWSRKGLLQEGVPDTKIQVIPLAYECIRLRSRHNREITPDTFSADPPLRVLFLGQLISRKGIRELSEAIRQMQGLPVLWHLVGYGDPQVVASLRKLPQTIVPGPVSRSEATRYYQAADVFILPTHSDGFAITQLEACSYGLPIIASDRCGQVVQHEQTRSS